MKNINQQALTLAHSIKASFTSFRIALLNAYKVLKSSSERERILNALANFSQACFKLGMSAKYQASIDAWLAIWNMDYLD
jgi:hypothetical protein